MAHCAEAPEPHPATKRPKHWNTTPISNVDCLHVPKKMKTIYTLVLPILFSSIALLNLANAESRNFNIAIADGHHVEFSIGQIQDHSTAFGKPAGGWTSIPFSIKNPARINGSHDFTISKSYSMTEPFAITSDINKLRFDMVVSVDDSSMRSSPFAAAMSAKVELVDANTQSVLATLFTEESLSDANWTSGMGDGPSEMDNVAPSYVGHTAYVRLSVQWDTTYGQGTFDAFATSGSDALSWVDMRPPQFSPLGGMQKFDNATTSVANAVTLFNAPNPVVDVTTIHLQGASAAVSLKIYDMLGREVADLTGALSTNSSMDIAFNASALRSGMYFYRLVTETSTLQRQMIVKH